MTNAYAWVANQEELMKGKKRSFKTEDWVREQQDLLLHPKGIYPAIRPRANKIRRQEWEDLLYGYGIEADKWMKQEARARRIAEERGVSPGALAVDWVVERLDREDTPTGPMAVVESAEKRRHGPLSRLRRRST